MEDQDFQHNFHTHTYRCKHAKGDVSDYCEAALEMGMKTLGFSDHSALPDDRWIRVRMSYAELNDYVVAVDKAKDDYPALRVLKGMECEYIPEFHAFYEDELFGKYQFDYLVGGAHFFPDGEQWRGTYGGTDSPKSLRQYGDHVVEMMASGLFDFVAHPDLFGNCYLDWDENTAACSRDILRAAADLGVAMEINALGLAKIARKKADNPFPMYPWLPFWELATEFDVEVIVKSDAHRPEDLQRRTGDAFAIQQELNLAARDPADIGRRAE